MCRMLLFLIILVPALFLVLSCSPDATGPVVYERIVIDTYGLFGSNPDTDLILYDKDGNPLGSGDATGSAGGSIDTYDDGIAMSSGGVYYIKVYDSDGGAPDPYVIRILSLAIGESIPSSVAPPEGFNLTDSPYEIDDNAPGNVPTDPVEILLGNDNYRNRYLDSSSGDVDWLKLVLP